MTSRSIQRGVPNYVTPVGLQLLLSQQGELERQRDRLRSAAGNASAINQRLSQLTRRWSALNQRICSAVLVAPASPPRKYVTFGATVTFRVLDGMEAGHERRVQITGVDQAEQQPDCLAFTAPLARAMMGLQAGITVRVDCPGDFERVEILSVEHSDWDNAIFQ